MSLHNHHGNIDSEPNSALENLNYFNRLDEAFMMFSLSILRDIIFHVEILGTPNEVWINLDSLFRNTDDSKMS